MTEGDSEDRDGLDKRWTVVIVTVVVALAAVTITAIVTFGSNPAKTTSASTTTTHLLAASSTTTIPPSPSTTSTQATTTSPSSVPAHQTITYGSPNGTVVWQSGDPIPAVADNAYEGYYCCNAPFPDGMNRSGSAGCSGQGSAPNIVGGYYANGQLC
jgi:hypothetical protein